MEFLAFFGIPLVVNWGFGICLGFLGLYWSLGRFWSSWCYLAVSIVAGVIFSLKLESFFCRIVGDFFWSSGVGGTSAVPREYFSWLVTC